MIIKIKSKVKSLKSKLRKFCLSYILFPTLDTKHSTFDYKRGFTLVELLLVVGIIGIIAGIGGDMFATVMRAYRKAELFSYVERSGNNILTQVEQDLRSAGKVDIPVSDPSQITLSIPTSSGTILKTYDITDCGAGTQGNVTLGGASIMPFATSSFLNTKLYITKMDGADHFTYFPAGSGKTGVVNVSFTIFVASLDTACTNVTQRIVESDFTTSVNLRGGIQ